MPQATRKASGPGRYIYAIIPDRGPLTLAATGLDETPVYCIGDGRVAAVVSDLKTPRIRPQRRNMAAHQGVLRALLEQVTPLPAAFGLVADSEAAIKRILKEQQQAFLEQLNRVDGCVEMGVRAAWDVPNIFEFFVATHEDLRAQRDSLFGGGAAVSQDQKISLGAAFEHQLGEDREQYTEQVEALLHPVCREIKRNKCRNEREVMNLACLVPRSEVAHFEAAVGRAAAPFDDNYAFDFNGPWAPHNFVELEIRL